MSFAISEIMSNVSCCAYLDHAFFNQTIVSSVISDTKGWTEEVSIQLHHQCLYSTQRLI